MTNGSRCVVLKRMQEEALGSANTPVPQLG
jgi:hypothetical protein